MSYGKRLPELERADIQKWIDYLSGEVAGELYEVDIDGIITNVKTMKKRKAKKIRSEPLSPKTINEHINFLGAVYKFHGLDSPCKQLIRPKTQRERVEEFKAYTQEEVQTILRKAKEEHEGKRLTGVNYFFPWATLRCPGYGADRGEPTGGRRGGEAPPGSVGLLQGWGVRLRVVGARAPAPPPWGWG
jgi:hypothetical protein